MGAGLGACGHPSEWRFLKYAAGTPKRQLIAESLLHTLAVERDFEAENPELYEVGQ